MSDATDAATLRQWAQDAVTATNATNWVGTTYNATKDATLKTAIQRLGVLASHIADALDGNHFAS